jgi:hypothetical protein
MYVLELSIWSNSNYAIENCMKKFYHLIIGLSGKGIGLCGSSMRFKG